MTVAIGMVGLGWMGHRLTRCIDRIETFKSVAGADPAAEARARARSDFEFPTVETPEKLISQFGSDLDAVVISTPHQSHSEHALQAVSAELDVLVEKPLATTASDAVDVVSAAHEADVTLRVGYHRRFHPAFKSMRERIRSGELGAPRIVSWGIGQNWRQRNQGTWRLDPALGGWGGQLDDTGSHVLECLFWILDASPVRVSAIGDEADESVLVNTSITATFRGGAGEFPVSITISGESTGNSPDEFASIWGGDGRIRFLSDPELDGGDRLQIVRTDGKYEMLEFTKEVDHRTLTRKKLESFAAAVESNVSSVPTDEILTLAATREAVRRACKTSSSVVVRDLVPE